MTSFFSRNALRLILLVAYLFASFFVAVFFSGGGHGSFAPAALLGSWAFLVLHGMARLGDPGVLGIVIVAGYYLALLSLTSHAVTWAWSGARYLSLGLHAVGAAVCFSVMGQGAQATRGLVAISIAVAMPLGVGYFIADEWLARQATVQGIDQS